MQTLIETSQFRIDLKRMAKSGKYNKADMIEVLRHLEKDLPLPRKYQEHALFGKWKRHRECHIKPD